MKTTATRQQVINAIDSVNAKYGYKLEINNDTYINAKYYSFTIKTKSGIPGARYSTTGRRMPCASWHAHGYLFDEILRINPNAVIFSGGKRIDITGGNWIDINIGSCYHPCYFSSVSIM